MNTLKFIKRCWTSEDKKKCIKLFEVTNPKNGLISSVTGTFKSSSKDEDLEFNPKSMFFGRTPDGYVHLVNR